MRGAPGRRHLPREDQAEQGAEEDEDLVEHGRLRPQDGTVEVVLWDVPPSALTSARKLYDLVGRARGPGLPGAASLGARLLARW